LAYFFGKPKLPHKVSPLVESTDGPSDFEKMFKPFVLRKDAEIAPLNWFTLAKQRKGKQKLDSNYTNGDAVDMDETCLSAVDGNDNADSSATPRGKFQTTGLLKLFDLSVH